MATEKVVSDIEGTIKKVCADIKRKNGAVGCDKLDSLSKLVNSYTKLVETNREKEDTPDLSETTERGKGRHRWSKHVV